MNDKLPAAVIAYDFDGTLAVGNIQENSFFPDLGIPKEEFWDEVKKISRENEMDEILAYMYLLLKKASQNEMMRMDKKSFREHGKSVKYFPGVEEYFEEVNEYARKKGIRLEHFIISSGTKEMIEATSIAKYFKYIYASSFKFDKHDVAEWPALAINYTTKTQFLFRINKGVHNIWDNDAVNEYVPEENRPMPFKNMLYVGDGFTDVPCMRLIKNLGGFSIGVYDPDEPGKKGKVEQLLKDGRVSYTAPADYSSRSDLFRVIKGIIDQISARESIAEFSRSDASPSA